MDVNCPPTTRTQDNVKAAAKIAGIPISNKPVQLLRFSDSLSNDDSIKLLQLNTEVRDALQVGERVVIKGQDNDDAVLCTSNSTYNLKLCETSNTLLLCPELAFPTEVSSTSSSSLVNKEVIGCVSNIFELKKCRPKIERLKELLSESIYRGPLEESGEEIKYTFNDLMLLVQASEKEVMEALITQQACLIDGYWRCLDVDYRDEVVQAILTLLVEMDWHWTGVPLDTCSDKLSELYPPFIIKHCLECYSKSHNYEETGVVYELDEDKICRYYVEVLLRQAGRFNYDEFLVSWQESVPVGMTTNLNQLKGLALSDRNTTPPTIWYYPEANLPSDPSSRITKLFQTRQKWTYEQLEPYIKDLALPSISLNTLLLKYTRVSTTPTGTKLYSSKTTAL